jgi:hypothetical protein
MCGHSFTDGYDGTFSGIGDIMYEDIEDGCYNYYIGIPMNNT